MTAANGGSDPTDNGSAPPSTPNSEVSAVSEIRRLGIGGRASSPAKRTRDQRDGTAASLDSDSQQMDVDEMTQGPRSPKKSTSALQHVSPMPSRVKPGIQSEYSSSAADVSMNFDGTDGTSGTNTENNTVSTPPTSADTDSEATAGSSPFERPSYDDQYKTVVELSENEKLREGSLGYMVPTSWLNRVTSRTTQGLSEGHPKHLREGDVGPVSTTELALDAAHLRDLKDGAGRTFVPLKPDLSLGDDFEALPVEAWNLIVKWYGLESGSPKITRTAHKTATGVENVQYELFPPIFKVQKLRGGTGLRGLDSIGDDDKKAAVLVASRSENYQHFLKRAKEAAGISVTTKVRVWKVVEALSTATGQSSMPTPSSSRDISPAPTNAILPSMMVDLEYLNSLEEGVTRELVDFKDETANEKYNGSFKLGEVGFMENQTIILEEQTREGEEFRSESSRKVQQKNEGKPTSLTITNASKTKSNTAAARRSPTPSGIMTRGRSKKGRTKGTVGLQNLGNTCYMNSALQCIRAVQELTLYFLSDAYKKDLNVDNPLGYHGTIAKSYAGLIGSIYETDNSFSPRAFKNALGKAQPLFSGYGQQDSQEFLSFLIDGLHEDLNRIHKKPYLENPDSDDKTVHDPEAIRELGETYRHNHAARNDSVAMDLFSGFYKNTMVCPVCDKISVTFDPYSQVTLQLPIDSPFQHPINFAPLYGSPAIVDVDIDKNSTIKSLKEYIAKRVPGNISADRIILIEEYTYKIYKIFEDSEVLSEANIQANDHIWAMELEATPTNWPPKEKSKKSRYSPYHMPGRNQQDDVPEMDSPAAERMAIPIVSRLPEKASKFTFKLCPQFITITREEARDEETIFRKVLAKVQSMTTRSLLSDDSSDDQSMLDSTEFVDPNEGTGVHTASHGSNESFVDVSMSDAQESSTKQPADIVARSESIMDPGTLLKPELHSLFNISLYQVHGEVIPTGYSSLNERENYPSLSSRLPPKLNKISLKMSKDAEVDPDSSEDELSTLPTWRSSKDDEDKSSTSTTDGASRGSPQSSMDMAADTLDDGTSDDKDTAAGERPYLLRLGDGLVLDWTQEGYNQLFEGVDANDWKGRRTDLELPTIHDAELEAKRAKRNSRKKSGVTLDECFAETAKSEVLSEDNAWYCSRCKELRRATKTLELWTVPDILVVHLKRFSSGSRLRDKVEILVDFPTKDLDLTGRVGLPEDKSLTYDLFAVDNHYGGLGGGHYTAYAKNFFDDKWYDYNDSFVSQVKEESVVTRSAYLLFYRRRSETPLGPEYLQTVVGDAMSPEAPSSSSGEDQRPDDSSSLSGSSNRSQGVGANHPHRQGASRGQALGVGGGRDLETRAKSALNDDTLPSYTEAGAEDEGYRSGNASDPDNPLPGLEDKATERSFTSVRTYGTPGWSFNNIPRGPTTSNAGSDEAMDDGSDTLHDGDSNAPAAGSEAGGLGLETRMQTDFADDGDGLEFEDESPARQVVPMTQRDEDELPTVEIDVDTEEGA